MKVNARTFDPARFSFTDDPVLVIEDFWSAEERRRFQGAMAAARWKSLDDLPVVRASFPNCGNWIKADIGAAEAAWFCRRISLACVGTYIETFPNISRRHMSFSYYSYAAGDCLLTHDDTIQPHEYGMKKPPLRRLALVSYVHDRWEPDWGGELIIYSAKRGANGRGRPELSVSHCIAPQPGSLVLFTVPRYHRVCRVDPISGAARRLSIAGWLMTEHADFPQEDHEAPRAVASHGVVSAAMTVTDPA
ncbi:2OG-Fe(II) oxygenase [Candidatus Nitrospira bockiana]